MSFYHDLNPSFFPLYMSFILMGLFSSLVVFFKFGKIFFLIFHFFLFKLQLFMWGDSVMLESMSGFHSFLVLEGLKFSFILFLLGELMFFFCIFWLYFD